MAAYVPAASSFFLYLSNYLKLVFKKIDGIIHMQQDFSYLSEFDYDIEYRLVVEDRKELGNGSKKIHSIYFSVYNIGTSEKVLGGISKFLVVDSK